MKAWVEWHFADLGSLSKKGLKFDCTKCPQNIQTLRRCHEPIWDHEPGKIFPIQITPYTQGVGFCPSKLFRDDPEFCEDARLMLLAWKLGQVPNGGPLDGMTEEQADAMMALIQTWERITRAEDFITLGRMLGGSGESK
jgi:hypothetical protein